MKNSLVILLLLLLIGCSTPQKKAKGYVVISPEIAEIIAALGASDDIIAVTAECTYPEELQEKTSVGKFGEIKLEDIINLNPAIVFTSELEQQELADKLEKLGIKVVRTYPQSVAGVYEAITKIGAEIGRTAEAVTLNNSLKQQLEALNSNVANRPRVYLEIWNNPLMSVSDKSFVGELIELAGGDNIFTELERDYARVKSEMVINADPQIILSYSKTSLAEMSQRKGWENISAIKSKYVFEDNDINPDWLFRAGPRFVLGIKSLQETFRACKQ
ncbi:MAG: ABC transporter substrate-binding protein [Candidatus Cloacimonetes bacterium]|nr:ABC transporter substrate-binding protein [Candidatus Cloacimonadota bacterium]